MNKIILLFSTPFILFSCSTKLSENKLITAQKVIKESEEVKSVFTPKPEKIISNINDIDHVNYIIDSNQNLGDNKLSIHITYFNNGTYTKPIFWDNLNFVLEYKIFRSVITPTEITSSTESYEFVTKDKKELNNYLDKVIVDFPNLRKIFKSEKILIEYTMTFPNGSVIRNQRKYQPETYYFFSKD